MNNQELASRLVKLAKELIAGPPPFKMSDQLAKLVANKAAKNLNTSVKSYKIREMGKQDAIIDIETKDLGKVIIHISNAYGVVLVSIGLNGIFEEAKGKYPHEIQDLTEKAAKKLKRELSKLD